MTTWHLALLWALYFVQGLPFGFQATALPVLLREGGASLTVTSLAGAVAIPWLAKPLWAPWVDQAASRRRWMLPMQALIAAAAVAAAPRPDLLRLVAITFAMNLFAATLDIAVDGLAIDLVSRRHLGHANAAQVVGYKLGMLTGGGLWLWGAGTLGHAPAMLAVAGLVLAVMAITWLFREPPRAELVAERARPTYREVVRALRATLRVPGAIPLLLAVATYKLGESMADAMFKPFAIDAGFTKEQIGAWIGTWGMACSIAGSLGGGWLAARAGITRALAVAAVLRIGPLVGQWWLSTLAAPTTAEMIAVTSGEHFAGGALTTAMFALMMSRVDRRIGATHFTALAALEVVGKSVPSLLSGAVADRVGYAPLFAAAAGLSTLFLLLLPRLRQA
jgi:MFS family permease